MSARGDEATGTAERRRDTTAVEVLDVGRRMLGRYPRQTAATLTFMVLGSLTEGVSIVLLLPILRMLAPGQDVVAIAISWAPLVDRIGPRVEVSLAFVLIALAGLVAARAWFMRAKSIYTADLLCELLNDIRNSLFRAIAQARWEFVSPLRRSDLNHALTADTERIRVAIFQLLLLAQMSVLILVYAGISLAVSPAVTVVAALVGAVVLGFLQPIRQRASRYGAQLTGQRQDQYRIVAEFLAGTKVAKSFNAEPTYMALLAANLQGMREGYVRFVRLNTTGAAAFQTMSAVGLVLVVWIALHEFDLAYGQIVVLLLLFMRLASQLTSLQSNMQELLANVSALRAVEDLQASCEAERETWIDSAETAPVLTKAIRFDAVGFRYAGPDGASVFTGVSFEVPAGTITALIGPSGGGKSTAADLMMGLLRPASGTVLIDGTALDERNRRAWRDQVAYVPQDVFLLHDTIAANLRLATPGETSEEAMWVALRRANADGFVRRLPQQLQTVVGDRGVRLSGGERQRIALARALIRRPQLLILDEATSALDWKSQGLIADAIRALRGEMTVVTIAHRLSMIAFADWVVALSDGALLEAGPYAELARRGGQLSDLIQGENAAGAPTRERWRSGASDSH